MRGLKAPPRRIGRAAVADVAGDRVEHLLVLDRARPGDADRVARRPHLGTSTEHRCPPPTSTTLSSSWNSRLASLYGFMIGTTFSTPSRRGQVVLVDLPLFADRADDGAELAARQVRPGCPSARSPPDTRSIAACGALELITIIKAILLGPGIGRPGRRTTRRGAKRAHPVIRWGMTHVPGQGHSSDSTGGPTGAGPVPKRFTAIPPAGPCWRKSGSLASRTRRYKRTGSFKASGVGRGRRRSGRPVYGGSRWGRR